MKRNLRYIALILPMAVLFILFQQCSGVSFQSATNELRWQHECSQDSSKCQAKTESFDTSMGNKQIDFTWVIDNSGSMKEEVGKTQANLSNFASSLKNYSDLRMAVVSAKDSSVAPSSNTQGYYITLPSVSGLTTSQVNRFVSSNDILIMAALAICPANASDGSWCNAFTDSTKTATYRKDVDGRRVNDTFWNKVYSLTNGSLTNFVREQSHKVFVFVSDDDARAASNPYRIKGEQFLDAFQSRFPNASPVVYSIVSLRSVDDAKAVGCEVYAQGNEYMNLSAATNGKAFDICQDDWTSYFDEMLEGVKTLAKYSFTLATVNIMDITSVKINGVEIAKSDYVYANRTITIAQHLLDGPGVYNIQVDLMEYIP